MKEVDAKTAKDIDFKLPFGKHGEIYEVEDDFLLNVFTLDEKSMFDFLKFSIASTKGSAYTEKDIVEDEKNFLYFKGNIPVMLCAHVDTVKSPATKIYFSEKTKLLTAAEDEQIGGDDRAGVAGILEIVLLGVKPHLLFTRGEETGLKGATEAAKALTGEESQKKFGVDMKMDDIRCIIALDRCGDIECAYYNNGNEDFKKWVTSFGLKETMGTGNDIRVLCPAWDVSGVNVPIGYESAHTTRDYVSFPAFKRCIDRVEKMVRLFPPARFPFVENKEYHRYSYKNTTYYYPVGGSCNYYRRGGRGRTYGSRDYESTDYGYQGTGFGGYEKPKKHFRETVYPEKFIYHVAQKVKERLYGAMEFIATSLPYLIFDFSRMLWRYRDCDAEDLLTASVFDAFGVFDLVDEGSKRTLRSAVALVESMSHLWHDDYLFGCDD